MSLSFKAAEEIAAQIQPSNKKLIDNWSVLQQKYSGDFFEYKVRDKVIKQNLTYLNTLSGTKIPKVVLPKYKDWGDILKWQLQENVPGEFPYTAGVFELKREARILHECLPEKVAPSALINVFIM